MKKNVILLVNKFCPSHPKAGGAEKNLLEIFSRIGKNHTVVLVSAMFPGAKREEVYSNIHIQRIGFKNSENIIGIHIFIPFLLRSLVKKYKPDIFIEDESVLPFFSPLIVPKQKKLIIIHGLNGKHFFESSRFPLSLGAYMMEKLFFPVYRKETVVVVSEWMRKTLLAKGFSRVVKILNGVDESFFEVNKEYARIPTVLFLGRLEGRKGVDYLLKTYGYVKKAVPEVRYMIAGRRFAFNEPGWLKTVIEESQKQYGNHEIEFKGHVSEEEKRKLLETSWICVVPSRTEGYGIVPLEASATGTYCVGNAVEGLSESVVCNETGILVDCGNMKVLGDAIVTSLDLQRLKSSESKCRAWARKHSWDRAAGETEKLISDIISI